jgi:hypothetical protein
VSFSNCLGGVGVTFSITPAFNLTPVMIAAQPTNSLNGKGTGMQGLIASVDASGGRFSVNGADGPNLNGPTWPVSWNASAVFQGIGSGSQLVPGMPVDMDVSVQADGSLMATRVAVYDTDTSDLNVFSGPVVLTQASLPIFLMPGQQQEGILDESGYYGGSFSVDHSSAVFQISSALSNLGSLPFPANFDAANLVPGQNVSVTSHIASWSGNPLPAATVTLMPQTINGTVNAVSSEGGFTAYTVELANYDLFPDIATLPNLPVVLNNPGTVVVYADSSTQMLNSESAAAGSVLRFYGLVFDDNGTLRMVCAQINDGVAE